MTSLTGINLVRSSSSTPGILIGGPIAHLVAQSAACSPVRHRACSLWLTQKRNSNCSWQNAAEGRWLIFNEPSVFDFVQHIPLRGPRKGIGKNSGLIGRSIAWSLAGFGLRDPSAGPFQNLVNRLLRRLHPRTRHLAIEARACTGAARAIAHAIASHYYQTKVVERKNFGPGELIVFAGASLAAESFRRWTICRRSSRRSNPAT